MHVISKHDKISARSHFHEAGTGLDLDVKELDLKGRKNMMARIIGLSEQSQQTSGGNNTQALPSDPPTYQIAPGLVLKERYQIERILGQGSMGTTYKALDLNTQRPVAVKLLHFSRIQEWKVLEMFEREAKVLQQLDHPRIPTYIDYFSLETPSDVQFSLVQEYIEGKTLQEFVEKGWRGTEAEILDIFLQLVNILAYLHTLQPPVIHRDINPKNILLSPLNEVYLVDFGAVQERIRTTFLGGSTIVGTYGYVPFEQFSGQTVPASDYYALGATLLYMLTHRHPADFPTDDLKPQFHDSFRASPKVIRLLDGLLESSVKQRIASPDQIRAILEDIRVTQASTSSSPRQPKIPKPPWTKIQKIVGRKNHISFRIPKKVMGFLPGQTLFELTPKQVRFHDAYKIGNKIGKSWSMPTDALRPSDITWHFEREKPVLGINYGGNTFVISSTLALVEVEWLVQEIHEYIATMYIATLPEDVRMMLGQTSDNPFLQPPMLSKPSETMIAKVVEKEAYISFRVPKRILSPESKIGTFFRKEVLTFISRLLGDRMIEMTPTWIHLSNEYFGIKLGKTRHIPTVAIRTSDINWYFKKVNSGPDSTMQQLVVGINYAGRTLEIGAKLTQDEAEWLVQEIGQYVSNYAKSTLNVH
jgi:serine/threonine protein kinase